MPLIEGCKHSIEVTVPVAEVEKETERVVATIQTKARLPGFRPGKAPLSLIKSKFGSDIRQDVLEKIVPRFFRAAVDKEELQVVGSPNVTDVHFHDGEPLKFKAEFEVAPTIELGEYRGITITYNEPEVTDADVDARLGTLREEKAEYVNEEPRPVVDGDFAVVSLESTAGLAEKISQDELMLKIGDEATMPVFTENLRGATPGDVKEFEVVYPEDYDRPNLAGKTVQFRATVKAVRRKELPEINDEFAKDLGDYQTLDELRAAVRTALQHDREHKAQDAAKHQLLDKLVEAHDFPVPDAYIDRQIEMNVETQLRQLAAQGVDPNKIKLDWNKVRDSQKERATKDVKASLLIDKIAEREAIAATNDEVDREVSRIARQRREAVAALRPKLQKDGTLGRIASHIRTEKTLSLLFEQARKESGPAPVPAEDQPAE